ncbi:hypothetical protein [Streptomyces sp. NPDC019890]|uniref:hypothetical protein n=1 Tax=Streptomyces sp. NPDC019890 TaxID=3365064 RepID=UPI00384D5AF6
MGAVDVVGGQAGQNTPRAVQCAWGWIDRHVDIREAGLVLDPLLTKARRPAARAEAMLTPGECAELARLTVRWLSGHDSERPPLLAKTSLDPDVKTGCWT